VHGLDHEDFWNLHLENPVAISRPRLDR
jgi:hypothetical protein